MEILAYYDENNLIKLGEEERELIHENNLWHREVAVWIVNEKNELLLERRSSKKKQSANKLSIVAGHVDLGEDEKVAAMRETKEEAGITFGRNELNFFGVYRNEKEHNKCFSYTYFARTDKKIEDMIMQEDEVSELKYMSLEELEDRIKNQDEEINFAKKPYVKSILEKIKAEIKIYEEN